MKAEIHLTKPLTSAELFALILEFQKKWAIDRMERVSSFKTNIDGDEVAEWLIVVYEAS